MSHRILVINELCSTQVNGENMQGATHSKAVSCLRNAKGLLQIEVSREFMPKDISDFDKCNGNLGKCICLEHLIVYMCHLKYN